MLLGACGGEAKDKNALADGVRSIEVAVPPDSKPLSYTDENGELTGYEIEILKAVDEKLKDYSFDLVGVHDSAAEIGLDTGKYQMIAQGLFRSPTREEKYLIPEQNNGASLMRVYSNEKFTDIESLGDLVGKTISPPTPSGGVYNLLMAHNKENPDKELKFDTSDAGLTVAERLKDVESGKYDVLVLPSNLGAADIIEMQSLKINTSDPVKVFPTFFMIHNSEDNQELVSQVSTALSELKEEGMLSELSIKYYGEDVFLFE
ncbi:transporter substrate-binding domain-containing protein [Psychrobacillus lasiicapitis]|uniref:Transporter substrate-binding domain-containing protein n=2 Tax=Psychrobacillus lasiicapitis TaxID=1636719 RepID=A0A544TI61_9BACI|nr:transporter substrate-binding domain-containing protein [Psychrobacillus lasiicapitis]